MKKILETLNKICQIFLHPEDDVKTLYLLILLIVGFVINIWIATVEDTYIFLILYCGIFALLYKFGYKLKHKTIITIIIIELVCTYLLTVLALPDLVRI